MKNKMSGFGKIFSFTFSQQLRSKGYRTATILIALFCLLIPLVIITLLGTGDWDDSKETVSGTAIETVYVVDETGETEADWNVFNAIGAEGFDRIQYIGENDYASAEAEASKMDTAAILVLKKDSGGYKYTIVIPDNSKLTEDDGWALDSFLYNNFSLILAEKSGLSGEQLAEMFTPSQSIIHASGENGEEDGAGMVKWILSMVLPYVNVMIIYFLVLFYGQGVANAVVLEKSSKLMDTFLVSVRPAAMITGKVLAVTLSSVLQFIIWMLALVVGFGGGCALVKSWNPDTDFVLVLLFQGMGDYSGLLSWSGAFVGVLLILSGFFLYCSLAAIGGAIAGKQEDLSSTNIIFTLVLVVSFLVTLSNGGVLDGSGNAASVLNLIPFTSILILPANLILGEAGVFLGVIALILVLVVSVLILLLAGKIYQMMSFYKGNVPKVGQVLKMVIGK